MVVGVLAAAGRGVRLGAGKPKGFRELGGRLLFAHSLASLEQVPEIHLVWIVVPPGFEDVVGAELGQRGKTRLTVQVLAGGKERQDSVAAAVSQIPNNVDLVVVHDAARPFASPSLFQACIAAARLHGAAIAAVPVADTVKLVDAGVVRQTLDRTRVWVAQTPQVVRTDWLRDALKRAEENELRFTDESALLEHFGYTVHVVPGEETNRKLTTPEDWRWAEWKLGTTPN